MPSAPKPPFAFGLPQWLAGRVDPQFSKDLFDIGFIGPDLCGLVIQAAHSASEVLLPPAWEVSTGRREPMGVSASVAAPASI